MVPPQFEYLGSWHSILSILTRRDVQLIVCLSGLCTDRYNGLWGASNVLILNALLTSLRIPYFSLSRTSVAVMGSKY